MASKINFPAALVAIIMLVTGIMIYLLPHHFSMRKKIADITAERDSLAQTIVSLPSIDTIYRDTTIYVNMPPVVSLDSVLDTFYIEGCNYLRTYRDSAKQEEITLYWDLQTKGTLIGMDIWYDLHVPLVITKTVPVHSTTVTNPKNLSFYGELGYLYTREMEGVFIGARVSYKRYGLGYSYAPNINGHLIGASYKIE